MKAISNVVSFFCMSALFFISFQATAANERSMCQGDCANSPVPIKDVMALSKFSQHLSQEQLTQVSNELLLYPKTENDSEMVTVKVIIMSETFDPKKHSPKRKALPFDEGPESALFLTFDMPSTLSTATEGRNRISFDTATSNSMLHKTELQRKDGATRTQQLDGIGQVNQLTVEKGNKEFSITMTLREFRLIGSPDSIFAYPSGDNIIEKGHTAMGYEDTYGRKLNGMNQVKTDIRDANGKSLDIQENKSYVLPMLVQLKKFDRLDALSSEDGKSETTLVTGVQAAVPLGSKFRQAGFGTQATLIHNRQLREGLIATLAASMAVNIQRTFGNGYQPFDKPTHVSWGGDISAGLTCLGKNGSSTTTTLFLSADPTPLNAKDYKSPSGSFLKRQSQGATTERDYAVGLAVTHQTAKGLIVSGGCKEDIGGSQKRPKSIGGNNNRDFSCGFSASKNF